MTSPPGTPTARPGVAVRFLGGVRLYARGLGLYARSPGLIVLGVLPALLALVLVVGGLVVLAVFIDELAGLVTWFADDWRQGWRDVLRIVAGLAIFGLATMLGILLFTALTLAIGDPFFEKIAERVEDRFGGVPDVVELPWWRSLGRGLGESARLLGRTVLIGLPLFVAGFVPFAGQTVVPVIGAFVAGWFLAVELVGVPFSRRGLRLADRLRLLRADRATALGFGVSVFLTFLIPLGAVLLMPAAVAGGTLLARRALGLSTQE